MSQNIRATPCSTGRHGSTANVLGSGIAIMSDSSIGLKPVIEEPSNPIPPTNASLSSVALIENALSWPSMSVNHRRIKRMSRSSTSAATSSAVSGVSVAVMRPVKRSPSCARVRYLPCEPTARTLKLVARWMGMISIVVVLAACGSSAAETTSGACKPDGSHTLALSPQARVYSLDKTVYGCAYSTGKQRQLGKLSSCVGSHQVEAVDV